MYAVTITVSSYIQVPWVWMVMFLCIHPSSLAHRVFLLVSFTVITEIWDIDVPFMDLAFYKFLCSAPLTIVGLCVKHQSKVKPFWWELRHALTCQSIAVSLKLSPFIRIVVVNLSLGPMICLFSGWWPNIAAKYEFYLVKCYINAIISGWLLPWCFCHYTSMSMSCKAGNCTLQG